MLNTRWVLVLAVGAVTAGVAGIGGGSRAARACSRILAPPSLQGTPADGESDVPTDVVPVYDLSAAQLYDGVAMTGAFSLTDDAGTTVPATLRLSYLTSFELVPATPLRALTRYTLAGTWTPYSTPGAPVTVTLGFTTGAGPWAGSLAGPPAFLQHYVFQNVRTTTCNEGPGGTCVSVPAGALTRMTYIDSFGQEQSFRSPTGDLLPYLMTGSFLNNLSGVDQGTDFRCVKLMARGANGTVGSDATVLCRDDGPTFALNGSPNVGCSPEGLTHDGIVVARNLGRGDHLQGPGDHAGWFGCSVAAARPGDLAGWAPLLLLAAIVAGRARRLLRPAPRPRAGQRNPGR